MKLTSKVLTVGTLSLASVPAFAHHPTPTPSFDRCVRESACLVRAECKPLPGTSAISVRTTELKDRTLVAAYTRLVTAVRDQWVCPSDGGTLTRFSTNRDATSESFSEARYVRGHYAEAEQVPADVYQPVLDLANASCELAKQARLDLIPACDAQ